MMGLQDEPEHLFYVFRLTPATLVARFAANRRSTLVKRHRNRQHH
jgi:hypothetical protein